MTKEKEAEYKKWVESRPPPVRKLAERIRPGTTVDVDGTIHYVVGFREHSDGTASVLISETNPAKNYRKALDTKKVMCPCCVEKLINPVNN